MQRGRVGGASDEMEGLGRGTGSSPNLANGWGGAKLGEGSEGLGKELPDEGGAS